MIEEILAQSNLRVSGVSVPTRQVTKSDFAAAVESNREGIGLSLKGVLDSIEGVSSSKDNADAPVYPSHQPTAEINAMYSREQLSNASLASAATISETVIAPKIEGISSLKELSQSPDVVATQDVLDQIRASASKGATVAGTIAQSSDLSNGSFIISSGNSVVVNGNSVQMASDTGIDMSSPLFNMASQDFFIQSNNSFVSTASVAIQEVGTSILTASGTDIRQSATTLDITSGAYDNISNTSRTVGSTSNFVGGGEVGIASNRNTEILAGGNLNTVSYKDSSVRGSNLSLMAVDQAGINVANPTASIGDIDGASLPLAPGGNVTISSITPVTQSSFIMATEGLASTTTGTYLANSVGPATISSSTSSFVVGTASASIMNSSVSLNLAGPFARLGRGLVPSALPPIPLLAELPKLPSIPSIPADLANCIPSKYKTKSEVGDGSAPSPTGRKGAPNDTNTRSTSEFGKAAERAIEDARKEEIKAKRSKINPSSARTSNQNPTRKAQEVSQTGVGGNAKIPPPTSSQEDSDIVVSNSAVGLNIKAPLDIFLDKPSQSNPIVDYLITSGLITDTEGDGAEVAPIIRLSDFTSSALEGELSFLNASDKTLFNNPQVLDVIGTTSDLATSTFQSLPQNERDRLIAILRNYPQALPAFIKLKNRYLSSIGVLAVGFIPSGILGNARLTFNFAKVISKGDKVGAFNAGRNLLSSALPNSPIANILNNSSFVNIGNALLTGQNIQKVILQEAEKIVLSQVQKHLPPNLQSAAFTIRSLIIDLKNGGPIDEQRLIGQISSILQDITGVQEFSLAANVYNNLRRVIASASSGDYLSLLGGDLSSLAAPIIGGENAAKMQQVLNTILVGINTGKVFAKIPKLLSLMRDYNIPAIDQVSTILSCLDLVNQIKALIDSIEGLIDMFKRKENGNASPYASINPYTRFDTPSGIGLPIYMIESLPRLIQVYNSGRVIAEDPVLNRRLANNPGDLNFTDDEAINSLIAEITGINLDLGLSDCFKLPTLTLSQSEVNIIRIEQNRLFFSVPNFSSEEGQYTPSQGDFINYKVSYFLSATGERLYPYQTNNQYTPSVYKYVITSFNPVNNIGVAVITINSFITLRGDGGILKEYSTQAIGLKINPIIIDSYLAE